MLSPPLQLPPKLHIVSSSLDYPTRLIIFHDSKATAGSCTLEPTPPTKPTLQQAPLTLLPSAHPFYLSMPVPSHVLAQPRTPYPGLLLVVRTSRSA